MSREHDLREGLPDRGPVEGVIVQRRILKICVLLCRADPSRYEAAVVRWLGRLCLERPRTTITDLRLALAAFERLPDEPEAEAELRQFVRA